MIEERVPDAGARDEDTEREKLSHVDFSLVLGGPLYQVLRRAHLSDDTFGLLKRRIILIPIVLWAPMAVLALIDRFVLGHRPDVLLLIDLEILSRYLLALPLLIYAELIVHQRMRPIIAQFLERNLVVENSKLRQAVESAFRVRNSLIAELFLLALVYSAGILWRQHLAIETDSWYAAVKDGKLELTWTGIWYSYVSLPLFQFILLRWYFRLFIWGRFLWHVSRTKLNLIPTHPDRVGGLGFLGGIAYAFAPLLMAHGVLLAGLIANRIFFVGASLPEFKLEIFAMITVLIIVVLSPLMVFIPQLNRTKRTGLREYGTLAQRYVREFDHKWLRSECDEQLVGSGDIQSLADLGNSFLVIKEMRLVPFTRETIFQLAVTVLIPLIPLTLTMFSFEQLLDRFLTTVF
jgi:hypothetical protein